MNENGPLQVIELNFSSTGEGEAGKLGDVDVIWKDIMAEGKYPMLPGQGGRKIPFEVTATGESSLVDRRISMTDLIQSFDDQAFPSGVTIPDGHPKMDADGNIVDSALNNTGYVNGLRVVKKGDTHTLQAALGFTEPDAAGKVKRGTVPNVSAGVLFNWLRKDNLKKFRAALNHVALTKMPWMNVQPFQKVFASDDAFNANDMEIGIFSFADDTTTDNGGDTSAEVIWNEKEGANWVREALGRSLAPEPVQLEQGMPYTPQPDYYVEDVDTAQKLSLVTEWYKGDKTRWVIPYTRDGDEVKPVPSTRWVQGQEALIAASDKPGDTINFEDITPEKITDKLGVKLSDMVGGDDFAIESVSLDNRCRIRNKKSGQGFEASFRNLTDGAVMLDDAADWVRTDKVDPQAGGPQPAPVDSSNVVQFYDDSTMEGRLSAARQLRRQKLAGSN